MTPPPPGNLARIASQFPSRFLNSLLNNRNLQVTARSYIYAQAQLHLDTMVLYHVYEARFVTRDGTQRWYYGCTPNHDLRPKQLQQRGPKQPAWPQERLMPPIFYRQIVIKPTPLKSKKKAQVQGSRLRVIFGWFSDRTQPPESEKYAVPRL